MNDTIKKIAVNKLLELKGKEFIILNKGNFAISYTELDKKYIVTFLLSTPTNNVSIRSIDNLETTIEKLLRLSINKNTQECLVLENTF